MLNIWCFNNTFTKHLLPYANSYLKNQIKSQQVKKFNENFNGLIDINNSEIINTYSSQYHNKFFNGSLFICENKFKYPFSGNYIPNEYCEVHTNIFINNLLNVNTNFIQEKFIIKPHNPSPYYLNIKYFLKIDGEFLVNKEEYGELSSDTLNMVFTNDDKANNLLKKLSHYVKLYPTKIDYK